MQGRSYMFSVARKRSTLLESKGIEFPKEEESSPRMRIVQKECPDEFGSFKDCLVKNASKPEACISLKQAMFECGKTGFKKANTDANYIY